MSGRPDADQGHYLAVMHAASARRVAVGALGEVALPAGDLVYVGSAQRGLAARVARHRGLDKRLRWHVGLHFESALDMAETPTVGLGGVELCPGERHGNRGPGARPQGEGRDHCGRGAVAQPVDEDTSLAFLLQELDGGEVGCGLHDEPGDRPSHEPNHVERRSPLEGGDDMDPLRAGHHRRRFDAEEITRFNDVAPIAGSFDLDDGQWWEDSCDGCREYFDRLAGDVDGDGRADLVGFRQSEGVVYQPISHVGQFD